MARKILGAKPPSAFDWPPGSEAEVERLAGVLLAERDFQASRAALHPLLIELPAGGHRRRTKDEPPVHQSGPSPVAVELLRRVRV